MPARIAFGVSCASDRDVSNCPLTSSEKISPPVPSKDEVIFEPTGGAHRDKDICLINVRESIRKNLEEMKLMSRDEILSHRKNKFLSIGRSKGFASTLETDKNLTMKENPLQEILLKVKKFRFHFIIVFCLLIFGLIYYLL